jgi:hypothetical protein
VVWTIAYDHPALVAGHPEGQTWRWSLQRADTGAGARIDVCIHDRVPADSLAHASCGRSVVERVLDQEEPPARLFVWPDGTVTDTQDR